MAESADAAALRKARNRGLLILAAFVLFCLALLAIVYVAVRSKRPDLGDLATQLCDPESMLTRDVVQGARIVSGQVNARSPAGGYSGYRAFVVDRATGHAEIAQANWGAECTPQWTADRRDLFIPNGLPVGN